MPLCASRTCGCAITSTEINITGDGSPGSPWTLSGASIGRVTEAQRLALSGGGLFEGRYVHTTDTRRLWRYSNSAWELVAGDCRWEGSVTQSVGAGATVNLTNFTEAVDTDAFYPASGATFTIPAGLGGNYAVFVFAGPVGLPNQIGEIRVAINGPVIAGNPVLTTPSGAVTIGFTQRLAAGNTINVVVFNGHTGSLNYNCFFKLTRLGL